VSPASGVTAISIASPPWPGAAAGAGGVDAPAESPENAAHRKLVDQPIYGLRRGSSPRGQSVSPRPRVAAERRAVIVRATIRCLARDGYAGLTMKRVAAEAGLSPGILHYYFRDKRAILASAAATVTGDLDCRVAAEARGARDARARLRALLRACFRAATESRDFWTVFIELWGEALHDRELARLNRHAYARARRLLEASVTRG